MIPPLPHTPSSSLVFVSSKDLRGENKSRLCKRAVFSLNSPPCSDWPPGGPVIFWVHTDGGDFIWVNGKGCFCVIHPGVRTGLSKGFVPPGLIAEAE